MSVRESYDGDGWHDGNFFPQEHSDKSHSQRDKLGWCILFQNISKENEFSNEYNVLKSVGRVQGKRDLNTKISMAWLGYFE